MNQHTPSKEAAADATFSKRAMEVMCLFGLDRRDLHRPAPAAPGGLPIRPGQIGLITGPSGAGKSTLLRQFYEAADARRRLWLSDVPLAENVRVIDCVEGSVSEALRILCKTGLGDVFAILNRPGRLSEGQQYRYRLARALLSGKQCLFADDFGGSLDPITAGTLAYQIRRMVCENRLLFFAASCHSEAAAALRPDLVIKKDLAGNTEIVRQKNQSRRQTAGAKSMPPVNRAVHRRTYAGEGKLIRW